MKLRPLSVTDRRRTTAKIALVSAITIAAALLPAPAAHAITSGAWTYVLTGSEVSITGYDSDLGGRANVSIPAEIDTYVVTAIGAGAFSGKTLTGHFTMPDTITTIGEFAFGNNQLVSIHLSNSLNVIGPSAFSMSEYLTSIVLPYGVTSIGENAFYGNTRLATIASLSPTPPPTVGATPFGTAPSRVSATQIQVSTGSFDAWKPSFGGLDVVGVECVNASGGYFAGGSGTTSDPYTIATAAQLDSIRSIYRGCDFELMTDISLQPYIDEHPGGPGGITSWYPIGGTIGSLSGTFTAAEVFTGNFDGSNHSISNLELIGTGNGVGLFGVTFGATIKNLQVSGNVAGGAMVGGLAGYAQDTTITRVSTDVDVTSSLGGAGGLLGQATDVTIEKSSATGTVTASLVAPDLGGLIGSYEITTPGHHINQSFASGNVSGTRNVLHDGSTYIGGLIGEVTATSAAYASITDVYATGDVSGDWQVGALIGSAQFTTMTRALAVGHVYSQHDVGLLSIGGLIGQGAALTTIATPDLTVNASYWDTATTGFVWSAPHEWDWVWALATGAGGPRTTAQMKAMTTYATTGWNITSSSWSDTAVWGICSEANNGYPYLLAFSTAASHPCADPVPDSPAAPDVAPVPLTTVTPTVSPIVASPPVSSIPASTSTTTQGTTPEYPKISASTPATFKTALAQLSRSVPASSTVEYSIPRVFQKNCAIRRGKIVALKAGTCGIRITSTTPKGRQTNQRVYLTVT